LQRGRALLPTIVWAGALIVLSYAATRACWVIAVPVGAEQHFVSLGVPIMFLLHDRERSGARHRPSSWWPWIAVALLLMVPLEYTAYRFTEGWAALAAYPRLYAAWLLWGLALREMLRRQKTTNR
jgi:endonuclease/exonuclease/phosphatase (EEP) superfamily protein YafD